MSVQSCQILLIDQIVLTPPKPKDVARVRTPVSSLALTLMLDCTTAFLMINSHPFIYIPAANVLAGCE